MNASGTRWKVSRLEDGYLNRDDLSSGPTESCTRSEM